MSHRNLLFEVVTELVLSGVALRGSNFVLIEYYVEENVVGSVLFFASEEMFPY